METQNKKTEYEKAKEVELSAKLAELAKNCQLVHKTETSMGNIELRNCISMYVALITNQHGNVTQALQIDTGWRRVFDNMALDPKTDKDDLLAQIVLEAVQYQHLFIEPEPFKVPEIPAVTPMISDGNDGFLRGIDHRLVKATLKSEPIIEAYGIDDDHSVTIYRTPDNFFIGEMVLDTLDLKNKTGIVTITYVEPEDVAALQAKIGRGSAGHPDEEQDEILQIAIAAVKKAAAEKHPVTPWDLIPNEVLWAESRNW